MLLASAELARAVRKRSRMLKECRDGEDEKMIQQMQKNKVMIIIVGNG